MTERSLRSSEIRALSTDEEFVPFAHVVIDAYPSLS